MSAVLKPGSLLSEAALRQIDREVAKYPADQKQSAVMAALRIAQSERGWPFLPSSDSSSAVSSPQM